MGVGASTKPPSTTNEASTAVRNNATPRCESPERTPASARSKPTHRTTIVPGIAACRCERSLRPRAERNEIKPKAAIRNAESRSAMLAESRRAIVDDRERIRALHVQLTERLTLLRRRLNETAHNG